MADDARLDVVRLRAELFFIHRDLGRAAATQCKSMLDDLHAEAATPSVLIWRSLLSDCLRVVYSAVMADGVIYDKELDRIRDLVLVTARHFTGTESSPYGHRPPVDHASIRTFLSHYAQDPGTFGYLAEVRWRGLRLCRRAEAAAARGPLLRYARLMWWLIGEACRVSDVSLHDPQYLSTLADIHALRQELTSAGFGPEIDVDRRIQVFLSGARVFTQIQHALSVHEADPFDVETLHGDARTSFAQLVKQATTTSSVTCSGRTLLVLGGSGSGKTHLLRAFWSYAQEYGRGFVAYAQMCADVDDYTRYLLKHIVESLQWSYSGAYGGHTGLQELAKGLVRLKGGALVAKVERLPELTGGPRAALDQQINEIVDELLDDAMLGGIEADTLRALLYALCFEPKTTARVYQYLRCEAMNDHDRSLLGNVIPRTARDDPKTMIRRLARLAFATRSAALVLMVDQIELSGVDSEQATSTFRRALDALIAIASEEPSIIVVIACLADLHSKAQKVLGRPTLDRLEKDPPPSALSSNLSFDEIKALVSRRLAWVFAEAGAAYRAAEPIYPLPENQLRNLVNRRPRDVLEWCQQFQERCIREGKLASSEPSAPPGAPRIEDAWQAACDGARVPASLADDEILALVTAAAQAYAAEVGAAVTCTTGKTGLLRVELSSAARSRELVIGVANKGPQAGSFGTQIKKLRQAARGAIAVAVRTAEFPTGAMSVKSVTQLTEAGGRACWLDEPTLQKLIAHRAFQPAFSADDIETWRRGMHPISRIAAIATMFALDQFLPEAPPTIVDEPPARAAPPTPAPHPPPKRRRQRASAHAGAAAR